MVPFQERGRGPGGSRRPPGHEGSTNRGAFGRERGLRSLWAWSLPSRCFAKQDVTSSNLNAAFLFLPSTAHPASACEGREERHESKRGGLAFPVQDPSPSLEHSGMHLGKPSRPPPPSTGPAP